MHDPVVSIVTPTWNQLPFIQGHIESIKHHTKEPHQIIVVDNGSSDGTIEWLREHLAPSDIVVHNAQNRGFSKANNQGLALAEAEHVLFLNNDIAVCGEDWLQKLLDGLTGADLVGPCICRVEPDDTRKLFLHVGEASPEKDRWVYVEGWCLFGKKETFRNLGGWCEDYFPTYCDDTDLGFRAKSAGLRVRKVPVPIRHYGNRAFPNYEKFMNMSGNEITIQNSRKLYAKWRNTNAF